MKFSSLFTRHPLRTGILFWGAFSILAVIIRGVRWDEDYEFAQVILGQIPFPQGHPLYQYVHSFFSLQPFSLAAFMHFFPDPLWANGVRNVLFLMASTIPIYLWGALLSKRAVGGHSAVIFLLLGIHISFYSSYPVAVWPEIFSNGPIGLGYMLLTLWALASQRLRVAGLLLGFAPLVHLGQFPPLLATAVAYVGWNLYQGRRREIMPFLWAIVPGLVACLAFAVYLRGIAVAPPTTGPYFTPTDPMVLWHTFMERYASHRAIPYTTGHLVLIGAMLLFVHGVALRWLRVRSTNNTSLFDGKSPSDWACFYMAVATSTVWLVMLAHRSYGPDVPYILVGWLPYRLMNHIAPLLIPLLIALCFRRDNKIPGWFPPLMLIALLAPLLHLGLAVTLVERYVSAGEYLFFVLYGAATTSTAIRIGRLDRRAGAASGLALLLSIAALGWYHQFGAACLLVGALLPLLPALPQVSARHLKLATSSLVAVMILAMLAKQGEARAHLRSSHFLLEVAAYLQHEGDDKAMILVPHQQAGMQMQLGHPVMADMATMFHGIYRPPLAPAVNAIFQDFYGMSLDPDVTPPPLAWHEVWPAKSLEEWQHLSEKYDLVYVIARSFMELPLDKLLPGSEYSLYRIPPREHHEPAAETPLGAPGQQ